MPAEVSGSSQSSGAVIKLPRMNERVKQALGLPGKPC